MMQTMQPMHAMHAYAPQPQRFGPIAPVRRRGTCKFFNSQKGYGFLLDRSEEELGGQEIFCHYSAIAGKDGFRSLAEGEEVEYDILQGPKGFSACNVTGPHGRSVIGDPKARIAKLPTPFQPMLYPPYSDPFNGPVNPGMSPYQHHVFTAGVSRPITNSSAQFMGATPTQGTYMNGGVAGQPQMFTSSLLTPLGGQPDLRADWTYGGMSSEPSGFSLGGASPLPNKGPQFSPPGGRFPISLPSANVIGSGPPRAYPSGVSPTYQARQASFSSNGLGGGAPEPAAYPLGQSRSPASALFGNGVPTRGSIDLPVSGASEPIGSAFLASQSGPPRMRQGAEVTGTSTSSGSTSSVFDLAPPTTTAGSLLYSSAYP